MVKNLPANTGDIEKRVQSLGPEDHLEQGMATHFNIFAWRIPWAEESGGLQSRGSHRVTEADTTETTYANLLCATHSTKCSSKYSIA